MADRLPPALRDRVVSIDSVESSGGNAIVLPSSGAVLGFQYRGRVSDRDGPLSLAGVTGIQPTAKSFVYEPGTGSVLVRFTPLGAACLGVPACELAGRSVALDQLLPRARVNEVSERLCAAPSAAERRAIVEGFLSSLPRAGDALVSRAIACLTRVDGGRVTVAAIARELGLSERQLERRFLARVGVTPRAFASLVRFERARKLSGSAPSLAALAQAAGYYDQSHFVRDFRRFAGAPPRDVLGRP